MKTRYVLLSVVAVYLIGNALYSDSTAMFVGHLIGHFFIVGVILFTSLLVIDIIIPDDARKVERWIGERIKAFKSFIRSWWHKPRPLLDAIIDLLTNPIARQRLIREANTGQLELQLDG